MVVAVLRTMTGVEVVLAAALVLAVLRIVPQFMQVTVAFALVQVAVARVQERVMAFQ
jgi:hypothetical protein